MKDSKYMTFKRDEMEKWMADNPSPGLPAPVPDAVVIRRQDVFAPPALEAYANAMMCVVEAATRTRGVDIDALLLGRLRDVADYFHQQAELAYQQTRKFPD